MTTSLKDLTAGQAFTLPCESTVYVAQYVKVGTGRTSVDYIIQGDTRRGAVWSFTKASLYPVTIVKG